jgi:hypothetical protein
MQATLHGVRYIPIRGTDMGDTILLSLQSIYLTNRVTYHAVAYIRYIN